MFGLLAEVFFFTMGSITGGIIVRIGVDGGLCVYACTSDAPLFYCFLISFFMAVG